MEVIPAINCPDVECARETLRRSQGAAPWIHLDVADARFTLNKTWGDPLSWPLFGKGFNLEVHLMVEAPEQVFGSWLEAGAKRVVAHIEALEDNRFRPEPEDPVALARAMASTCAAAGAELALGINPETAPERLAPYLGCAKRFLVLAVHPGLAGQRFLPVTLYTIEWLRRESPHATIEVDGGINPETARQVKAVGADAVVAASFLFHEGDIAKNIEVLKNI
jgi:ribulose-phosphate 3-epimerase